MDYEKKYKEALERFKLFKEKYYTKNTYFGDAIFDKTGEMQKDFNGIFPELREGEDERIRNCIRCLTSLDQAQDVIEDMGFTRQDLLVWLEKQKERKNPLEDYSRGYNDGYYHGFTDKQKEPVKWEDWKDKININTSVCDVYECCY